MLSSIFLISSAQAQQQGRSSQNFVIQDTLFNEPYIDVNEWRDEPVRHRYVHEGFEGTTTRFSFYFPPEAHIVNISSMGGFLSVPGQTLYGASKAAVKLITEGLYSELADTNVTVIVVFPGAIKTNITANSGVQTKNANDQSSQKNTLIKSMKPTEAANKIIEAMKKDQFRVTKGKDATLMD